MIDCDDGYRFIFVQQDDKRVLMKDQCGEFPDMMLPIKLSYKLGELLQEQHILRYNNQNSLSRFKGILEIVEEKQHTIDKDLLIAVINNLNFTTITEKETEDSHGY